MNAENFSASKIIGLGWKKTTKNLGVLVLISLIVFVPSIVNNFQTAYLKDQETISAIISLIFAFYSLWVGAGAIKIALNIADSKKFEVADLFSQANKIWKYFLAMLLYYLIVAAGLILLIVPGIIWSIKYQFAAYLIIDQKIGVIDAFRESARITKGNKLDLFGFSILLGFIIILGFIALGVGVLVAYPVAFISTGIAFRTLQKLHLKQ